MAPVDAQPFRDDTRWPNLDMLPSAVYELRMSLPNGRYRERHPRNLRIGNDSVFVSADTSFGHFFAAYRLYCRVNNQCFTDNDPAFKQDLKNFLKIKSDYRRVVLALFTAEARDVLVENTSQHPFDVLCVVMFDVHQEFWTQWRSMAEQKAQAFNYDSDKRIGTSQVLAWCQHLANAEKHLCEWGPMMVDKYFLRVASNKRKSSAEIEDDGVKRLRHDMYRASLEVVSRPEVIDTIESALSERGTSAAQTDQHPTTSTAQSQHRDRSSMVAVATAVQSTNDPAHALIQTDVVAPRSGAGTITSTEQPVAQAFTFNLTAQHFLDSENSPVQSLPVVVDTTHSATTMGQSAGAVAEIYARNDIPSTLSDNDAAQAAKRSTLQIPAPKTHPGATSPPHSHHGHLGGAGVIDASTNHLSMDLAAHVEPNSNIAPQDSALHPSNIGRKSRTDFDQFLSALRLSLLMCPNYGDLNEDKKRNWNRGFLFSVHDGKQAVLQLFGPDLIEKSLEGDDDAFNKLADWADSTYAKQRCEDMTGVSFVDRAKRYADQLLDAPPPLSAWAQNLLHSERSRKIAHASKSRHPQTLSQSTAPRHRAGSIPELDAVQIKQEPKEHTPDPLHEDSGFLRHHDIYQDHNARRGRKVWRHKQPWYASSPPLGLTSGQTDTHGPDRVPAIWPTKSPLHSEGNADPSSAPSVFDFPCQIYVSGFRNHKDALVEGYKLNRIAFGGREGSLARRDWWYESNGTDGTLSSLDFLDAEEEMEEGNREEEERDDEEEGEEHLTGDHDVGFDEYEGDAENGSQIYLDEGQDEEASAEAYMNQYAAEADEMDENEGLDNVQSNRSGQDGNTETPAQNETIPVAQTTTTNQESHYRLIEARDERRYNLRRRRE